MNRYLAIFAISSAATAGFYFASLLASPEPNVLADQTITDADTTRLYTLIVPRHLTQPSPLVFAFHGTGDTMQSMAEYSQLNRLACEQGFILVYPAATGPHWDTRVASGDSGNTDIEFFDSLLQHLGSQQTFDTGRVYAIGMSNGATFAQLLAMVRPHQVAAAVSHSGTPPPPANLPLEPMSPVMLIVGDLDPIHDSVVRTAAELDLPHISVSGLGHQWSIRHNAEMWRFLAQFTNRTK